MTPMASNSCLAQERSVAVRAGISSSSTSSCPSPEAAGRPARAVLRPERARGPAREQGPERELRLEPGPREQERLPERAQETEREREPGLPPAQQLELPQLSSGRRPRRVRRRSRRHGRSGSWPLRAAQRRAAWLPSRSPWPRELAPATGPRRERWRRRHAPAPLARRRSVRHGPPTPARVSSSCRCRCCATAICDSRLRSLRWYRSQRFPTITLTSRACRCSCFSRLARTVRRGSSGAAEVASHGWAATSVQSRKNTMIEAAAA